MRRFKFAAGAMVVLTAATAATSPAVLAAGKGPIAPRQDWSFAGVFGQYDKAQLQRGFQVYQEVCSTCHALSRVRFRNLYEEGGPEFSEEAVKQLAKEWPNQIIDGPNNEGEMFERPPKDTDPILGPYRNEKAARAAFGGAYPLDLSLITKARTGGHAQSWPMHILEMGTDVVTGYQERGADYVKALLTGYVEPPEGVTVSDGMYYNKYYPGNMIAMSAPLDDDYVEYAQPKEGSGVKAVPTTTAQYAKDVTAFLSWAGDPTLNTRKQTGWQVMLYLLITTVLLYLGKQRIWARAKKDLKKADA